MLHLILLALALPIRAIDPSNKCEHCLSAGSICGLVLGLIAVSIACVIVTLVCLRCRKKRVHLKRGQMLTTAAVHGLVHESCQETCSPSCKSESPPENLSDQRQAVSLYPSLEPFVHRNPMTVEQNQFLYERDDPVGSIIATHVPVLASAPIASLETSTIDDPSNGPYERFSDQERHKSNVSPLHSTSTDSEIDRSPPPPPSSSINPSDFLQTRRISSAFRGVARLIKTSILTGAGSRISTSSGDDTVILEGAAYPRSTNAPLSTGPTHLFKQKKFKRMGSNVGCSLRSGWKGKKSSAQDSGHFNFEAAELDELDASIDNDRFLYSLESAVFTTPTDAVSPLYGRSATSTAAATSDYLSEIQEGDLGGAWQSPFYSILPPCAPVIGFAFRDLDDEGLSVPERARVLQETAETGAAVDSTAPFDQSVSLVEDEPVDSGSEVVLTRSSEYDANFVVDSEKYTLTNNATTGVLSSSQVVEVSPDSSPSRLSVSEQDQPIHLPEVDCKSSGTIESWMVTSDKHLLIPPPDTVYSLKPHEGDYFPSRSQSSNHDTS